MIKMLYNEKVVMVVFNLVNVLNPTEVYNTKKEFLFSNLYLIKAVLKE